MSVSVKNAIVIPALALRSVTSKSGLGVYASSDYLFRGAVFGRDSLEVAEDLLHIKPRLVRTILVTLARLQGTTYNEENEEEIGKIIHEYRTTTVDDKPIDDVSLQIFHRLASKWGGAATEMAYYGSIDATPHFLRVLGAYCKAHGDAVLTSTITRRDNSTATVRESAHAATTWLIQKIASSRSGLVEFKRMNPQGISNQVWKDSEEFYVHENGQVANHDAPIASIEVQGLAYDALMAAAQLEPTRAAEYIEAAETLRAKTLDLLWQPERNYFALGIDYAPDRTQRIIHTPTANPAALLDSKFFETLPQDVRIQYLDGIIRKIMDTEFLTDAGIRSRSLMASHLVPFWDYHGSYVSWPKETYDIAKGLRKQGFPELATQLENRLLNIILKNKSYPEFVYVDKNGRALATTPSTHTHGDILVIESTNTPERVQAWTVSAIMAIATQRFAPAFKKRPLTPQEAWQANIEAEVLKKVPKVKMYINPLALSARYPTYRYRLKENQ